MSLILLKIESFTPASGALLLLILSVFALGYESTFSTVNFSGQGYNAMKKLILFWRSLCRVRIRLFLDRGSDQMLIYTEELPRTRYQLFLGHTISFGGFQVACSSWFHKIICWGDYYLHSYRRKVQNQWILLLLDLSCKRCCQIWYLCEQSIVHGEISRRSLYFWRLFSLLLRWIFFFWTNFQGCKGSTLTQDIFYCFQWSCWDSSQCFCVEPSCKTHTSFLCYCQLRLLWLQRIFQKECLSLYKLIQRALFLFSAKFDTYPWVILWEVFIFWEFWPLNAFFLQFQQFYWQFCNQSLLPRLFIPPYRMEYQYSRWSAIWQYPQYFYAVNLHLSCCVFQVCSYFCTELKMFWICFPMSFS